MPEQNVVRDRRIDARAGGLIISNAAGREVTSLLISLDVNVSTSQIDVTHTPGLTCVDPSVIGGGRSETYVLEQVGNWLACARRRYAVGGKTNPVPIVGLASLSKIVTRVAQTWTHSWGPSGRRHELGESAGVVATGPADELHAFLTLVRDHPPAVVILLEHPALAVEGLRDLRGAHEVDGGQ